MKIFVKTSIGTVPLKVSPFTKAHTIENMLAEIVGVVRYYHHLFRGRTGLACTWMTLKQLNIPNGSTLHLFLHDDPRITGAQFTSCVRRIQKAWRQKCGSMIVSQVIAEHFESVQYNSPEPNDEELTDEDIEQYLHYLLKCEGFFSDMKLDAETEIHDMKLDAETEIHDMKLDAETEIQGSVEDEEVFLNYLIRGQTGGGKRARASGDVVPLPSDPQGVVLLLELFKDVWNKEKWENILTSDSMEVETLKKMKEVMGERGGTPDSKAVRLLSVVPVYVQMKDRF